jgi:hydrogenase maturation factor HypF (carbamoyltransferase family)
VINPQNKKKFLWINLHGVTKRFISPADLKQQLIRSLKDNAPPLSAIDSFNVGCLQKPSQAKHWIISSDDLECMYAQLCDDEVSLWCYKRVVESGDKTARSSGKTKRSASSSEGPPTKRSAK